MSDTAAPFPADLPASRATSPWTGRLAWLAILIVGGLALSQALPRSPKTRDAAIDMTLPALVGEWKGLGESHEGTSEERRVLAADTTFIKQSYALLQPGFLSTGRLVSDLHMFNASIVMSGQDLNDSIHRLERCLQGQGFKELKGSNLTVDLGLGRSIKVRRIACYSENGRVITTPDGKKEAKAFLHLDGSKVRTNHVLYYWFVGAHTLSNDHFERTLVDMKDRLLGGFDQHWGYVLLGAAVTDDLAKRGDENAEWLARQGLFVKDPTYPDGRTAQQTDALLQEAVKAIGRSCIKWDAIHE